MFDSLRYYLLPPLSSRLPTFYFIVFASAITTMVCYNTERSEWASWIQAIGSISAIFLAFLIAIYQGEQNRLQAIKHEEDKEKRKLNQFAINIKLMLANYIVIVEELKKDFNDINEHLIVSSWASIKLYMYWAKDIDWQLLPTQKAITETVAYFNVFKLIIQAIETKPETIGSWQDIINAPNNNFAANNIKYGLHFQELINVKCIDIKNNAKRIFEEIAPEILEN